MDGHIAKPIELRVLIEVLGRFAPPRRDAEPGGALLAGPQLIR